jgi:hypothetical protein
LTLSPAELGLARPPRRGPRLCLAFKMDATCVFLAQINATRELGHPVDDIVRVMRSQELVGRSYDPTGEWLSVS